MEFPGVQLLDLSRTGLTIRWRDPASGKLKQQNCRRLGLSGRKLTAFMRELSESLAFQKRAKLLGLPLQPPAQNVQQSEPRRPRRPLADLCEDYLRRFDEGSTRRANEQSLRALTRLLTKPTDELESGDIVRLRDSLAQQGWARSTTHLRRQQIGTFLRWAVEREYLDVSDRSIASLTRSERTKEAKAIRILSPDQLLQVRQWFDRNAPADLRDYLEVQILTGMRVSEVEAIQKSWVMSDRMRIPASATKNRTQRDVGFDVSPSLKPLLVGQQSNQPFARRAARYGQVLRQCELALGLSLGGTHSIRRTNCAVLWSSGLLSPLAAAKRLGHTVQVAEKSYAELIPSDQLSKGDTLEQVLGLQ